MNFGEAADFKSPKACTRSRKLRKDSPIILTVANTKPETENLKSIKEESVPCLLTESERPQRGLKRKLYEEFSNLPPKHFKSEKELEEFLKNPVPEPDIHEQFVAKMTRVKQERIDHVIAQFEEKVDFRIIIEVIFKNYQGFFFSNRSILRLKNFEFTLNCVQF